MPKIEQELIAIKRTDGTVSLMSFLTCARGSVLPAGATWLDEGSGWWTREPSDVVVDNEIQSACMNGSGYVSWRRISADDVPSDRTYRDSWVDDGKAIVHDMVKARAFHMARLRRRRNRKLADLDAAWMGAVGTGNDKAKEAVEALRQELRDLPEVVGLKVEAANTIEELRACFMIEQ